MNSLETAKAQLLEKLPVSEEPKIFCLGLPKTGTTSFHHYLKDAGLVVAGAGAMKSIVRPDAPPRIDRFVEACIERFQQCAAFQDQPWCFFYDVYRVKFPKAKYVILIRPFEGWYKSFRYHLADRPQIRVMAEEFLGVPSIDAGEADYRRAFDAHYAAAAKATKGLSTITIQIGKEEAAAVCKKLNTFLGLSVAEFPHELNHASKLAVKIRKALLPEGNPGDADAILHRYVEIYGKDDATAKAERMIAKAQRKRSEAQTANTTAPQ